MDSAFTWALEGIPLDSGNQSLFTFRGIFVSSPMLCAARCDCQTHQIDFCASSISGDCDSEDIDLVCLGEEFHAE
jgi:hypothetical protein